MPSQTPQRVYLKDYRPPAYLIDRTALDIALDATSTTVRARLHVRRNPQAGADAAPLVLNGEDQTLISIAIDGKALSDKDFALGADKLTLAAAPAAPFALDIVSTHDPSANTALSGHYMSSGMFCTQCEAEGFRRITYFPDRPDILSVFTVRLEADKATAPILLSNGNLQERGGLASGRHYALWHDPFPKPSYLFALVGGDLAHIADSFTTRSGKTVTLGIYVEKGKEQRCAYAMDALKRAMRWDEERFGLEYDLDVFNIVAVSDFNMGAMENKGLNIFNDKYVLADPQTATDADYAGIESVIAHEYFHNWTGNRITCRDWFQLCLKEGLTVYRDQEFSADMSSAALKRIGDVKQLRTRQFSEDAGPLAHPVRPDSFIEINNFYTATVYEKGAELCRMVETLCGREGFRKGLDLYFARHDGEAATVEQFIACFADATGRDFTQFLRWYEQAGTPHLGVRTTFDAGAYEMSITQHTRPTPGQPEKKPLQIPLRIALLGHGGAVLQCGLPDIVELREAEQVVRVEGLAERPVPSLLRGFSAPVVLEADLSQDDELFLMGHDGDLFNRWQAAQSVATRALIDAGAAMAEGRPPAFPAAFADKLAHSLCDDGLEHAFRAQMLDLPSESDIALALGRDVDPAAIHAAREALRRFLAKAMRPILAALYDRLRVNAPYSPDAASAGRRSLCNAAMALLAANGDGDDLARVERHYRQADNMSDMMAALGVVTHVEAPLRADLLSAFYARFKDTALVIDKWFMLQAVSHRPDTLETVRALMRHEAFSLRNPNRIFALIGAFAQSNQLNFNRADGAGYRLVVDAATHIDKLNPQVAARLMGAFKSWRIMEPTRRKAAESALRGIAQTSGLSRDLSEMAERSLQASNGAS